MIESASKRMIGSWTWLVFLSTLLFACTDSAGFESLTFACSEDRPCAAGWRCQASSVPGEVSVCVRANTPEPDISVEQSELDTDLPPDTALPDVSVDTDLTEDTEPELLELDQDSDTDDQDATRPPPQYGETCDPSLPNDCAAGLACLPSGICHELCEEKYCADGATMCFGTSPEYVCPGPERQSCVEGPGQLQLCRDIELAFAGNFCAENNNGFPWWYHQHNAFPESPCHDDTLYFAGPEICLGSVTDSSLLELGGDLLVGTTVTSCPAKCLVLRSIELNGLTVVGGDLELGPDPYAGHCSADVVPFQALEAPVLRKVFGRFVFRDAAHVSHINYPELSMVGGHFVVQSLPSITSIYLPALETIGGGLRLHFLPSLENLELGSLRRIEGYVSIRDVPCVDPAVLSAIEALAEGPVEIVDSGTGVGCE